MIDGMKFGGDPNRISRDDVAGRVERERRERYLAEDNTGLARALDEKMQSLPWKAWRTIVDYAYATDQPHSDAERATLDAKAEEVRTAIEEQLGRDFDLLWEELDRVQKMSILKIEERQRAEEEIWRKIQEWKDRGEDEYIKPYLEGIIPQGLK